LPSAQQSHPQSPVHTPVSQQPQSQPAQQHAWQSAGHLPPQQSAVADEAGARKARNKSARKYMVRDSKWIVVVEKKI
jgi:hypothetical protein